MTAADLDRLEATRQYGPLLLSQPDAYALLALARKGLEADAKMSKMKAEIAAHMAVNDARDDSVDKLRAQVAALREVRRAAELMEDTADE